MISNCTGAEDMKSKTLQSLTAFLFALGVSLAVPATAKADAYFLNFNTVFGDTGLPLASSDTPWIQALFEDISPGSVRITLSALNLTDPENVVDLWLNLDPNLDPSSLSFNFVGGSGGFDPPTISTGADAFQADGDGSFDILFSFTTGMDDVNRFTGGEYAVFEVSGIATLQAIDFNFLSAPGGGWGPFFGAAHIQRIGPLEESTHIAPGEGLELIPEPQSLALLGLGSIIGLGLLRRRKANC
jgi:hypothetical protein